MQSGAGEAGLTLIELLVVMSILALAASVVMLNAPPSKPPARTAAEGFAVRIEAAFADAVIESAPYRLEIGASEYVISRFRDDEWTTQSRASVGGAEDDIVFRIEAESAAADNALALNGVEDDAQNDGDKTRLLPIDPYGGGASIDAHFESRRGNWIVSVAPDGVVTMERR